MARDSVERDNPMPTVEQSVARNKVTESKIDGMRLLFVPSGMFVMGISLEESVLQPAESPQHDVYLDSYWIDATEVSNRQYRLCVRDGICGVPLAKSTLYRSDYYSDPRYDDYPVVWVTWGQAQRYCEWAGRRLPTEAEWEKAARGADERVFPWGGTSLTADNANSCDAHCAGENDSSLSDGFIDTAPVVSFVTGASPYGALNMAGNVAEWVHDEYDPTYYARSPVVNPTGPDHDFGDKVFRGGSWWNPERYLRTTSRLHEGGPYFAAGFVGLRCATSDIRRLALQFDHPQIDLAPARGNGDALTAHQIPIVILADGGGRIALLDYESGERSYPIGSDPSAYSPIVAPNYRWVVFNSLMDGDPDIYLAPLFSNIPTHLVRWHGIDDSPTWSPDSRYIAFSSKRDGYGELYAVQIDGSGLVRLTTNTVDDQEPDWSPDGRLIVFVRIVRGNPDLYTLSLDGRGEIVRLTSTSTSESDPTWSPDGRSIAFVSDRDGDEEIYVMDESGSNVRRVTVSPARDVTPRWSSDGQSLLFSSDRQGRWGIYRVFLDGTGLTALTPSTSPGER